ncbi:MAG: 16S rRNA (cytosine(967)-C(5))-methyltransferase RsmB [Thermodesulfobacteriota bacterium]
MTEPDARKTAFQVLNALDRGHTHLDHYLARGFDAGHRQMARREKNLAFAIIYGVLRWRGRLDWIIGQFARQPIQKMRPDVLNLLRIGLFQIYFLDRIPDSAAVNTAVELAKSAAPPWAVKFVNGLLRNVVRHKTAVKWPDEKADFALHLSVDQSFPKWLVSRWIARFGNDDARQLCRFLNTIPPVTVRVNTLKTDRQTLAAHLEPVAESVRPTPYAPEGVRTRGLASEINELSAFQRGDFQVQDEAAQLVAHVLGPQPGETVLDACAGLGGKTGHITQLMQDRGRLVALDVDAEKLARLSAEMDRLAVSMVETRPFDLQQPLDPGVGAGYDRVLVDAPCSGLGVIRRNPDTKWAVSAGDFDRYRHRQFRCLENVCGAVAAGGVLVYAVCSMEPEETEDVIAEFLAAHPEFSVDFSETGQAVFGPLVDAGGFVRSLPHVHDMDGFFIARLKKLR